MDKNKKTEAVQELKPESVQEEIMAVADPGEPDGLGGPLVISLKAERVQEPESVSSATGARSASFLELAVNPYQKVTVDLQALQVSIILEQPMAGPFWGAGLGEAE